MIDTAFDFRSDTPPGLDPDTYSPTLRRYHQLLWSKPLPGGVPFVLDITTPRYLHHLSELGEFWLSSDTAPLPETLDAYLGYRQLAIEFIESRNRRIAAYDRLGS